MNSFRTARCLLSTTLLAVFGTLLGCHDNGYRTEVTPGSQGRYELQRVPEDPETIKEHRAEAAVRQDPDLTRLNIDWQKLSPQDRRTVLDLVHRLSTSGQ